MASLLRSLRKRRQAWSRNKANSQMHQGHSRKRSNSSDRCLKLRIYRHHWNRRLIHSRSSWSADGAPLIWLLGGLSAWRRPRSSLEMETKHSEFTRKRQTIQTHSARIRELTLCKHLLQDSRRPEKLSATVCEHWGANHRTRHIGSRVCEHL